ncbi:MAG: hypothetical protein LBV54_01505, partial [Puniceicoccales bacterium]|nr:hypothetical protein [Puniceicoccales bacterium]
MKAIQKPANSVVAQSATASQSAAAAAKIGRRLTRSRFGSFKSFLLAAAAVTGGTALFLQGSPEANADILVWSPVSNNPEPWDNASTFWKNVETESFVTYTDGHVVLFDDSAASKTVLLSGDYAPESIVVNNASQDYIFVAASPANIHALLIKEGSGVLKFEIGNVSLEGIDLLRGRVEVVGATNLEVANNVSLGIAGDTELRVVENAGFSANTIKLEDSFPSTITVSNGGKISATSLDLGTNGIVKIGEGSGTQAGILNVDGAISGEGTINFDTREDVSTQISSVFPGTGDLGSNNVVFIAGNTLVDKSITTTGSLTIEDGNVTVVESITTTGSLTIKSGNVTVVDSTITSKTLELGATDPVTDEILSIGTLSIGNGSDAGRVDTKEVTGNGYLVFSHNALDSSPYSFSGSGSGSVAISGKIAVVLENGTTIFGAPNTHTGGTKIGADAVLITQYAGTAGPAGGSVFIEGEWKIQNDSDYTINGLVTGSLTGTLSKITDSTLIIGKDAEYSVPFTKINAGTLKLLSNVQSQFDLYGITLDVSEAATALTITGDVILDDVTVKLGAETLAIVGDLTATGVKIELTEALLAKLDSGDPVSLITYTSGTAGTNFTLIGIPEDTRTGTFTDNSGTISFTSAIADLFWTGASGDGLWDLKTTSNWRNTGASDQFYNLDKVTFDNTA